MVFSFERPKSFWSRNQKFLDVGAGGKKIGCLELEPEIWVPGSTALVNTERRVNETDLIKLKPVSFTKSRQPLNAFTSQKMRGGAPAALYTSGSSHSEARARVAGFALPRSNAVVDRTVTGFGRNAACRELNFGDRVFQFSPTLKMRPGGGFRTNGDQPSLAPASHLQELSDISPWCPEQTKTFIAQISTRDIVRVLS